MLAFALKPTNLRALECVRPSVGLATRRTDPHYIEAPRSRRVGGAPSNDGISPSDSGEKKRMTAETDLVFYELDGSVAYVTMAFAPYNLLDKPLLDEIVAALGRARREGARAVVLQSKLRHFCAGAELSLFDDRGARAYNEVPILPYLEAIEATPLPLIASVHGVALGGGLELALACDIVVAAESAKFGMVEVTLGLHPLMGGIQRVAARAGLARAKEMAMFGRRIDAITLERWGVINVVVPQERLAETTRTMAEELAAGPTVAHAATKKLVSIFVNEGMSASDKAMADLQRPMFQSEDLVRALKAYRESGPGRAVFVGR
jgi:enoyl-CoA hydratase/carnithine racemase